MADMTLDSLQDAVLLIQNDKKHQDKICGDHTDRLINLENRQTKIEKKIDRVFIGIIGIGLQLLIKVGEIVYSAINK